MNKKKVMPLVNAQLIAPSCNDAIQSPGLKGPSDELRMALR